jgi:hypothetical protein
MSDESSVKNLSEAELDAAIREAEGQPLGALLEAAAVSAMEARQFAAYAMRHSYGVDPDEREAE